MATRVKKNSGSFEVKPDMRGITDISCHFTVSMAGGRLTLSVELQPSVDSEGEGHQHARV